jgi:hypothetical protein
MPPQSDALKLGKIIMAIKKKVSQNQKLSSLPIHAGMDIKNWE